MKPIIYSLISLALTFSIACNKKDGPDEEIAHESSQASDIFMHKFDDYRVEASPNLSANAATGFAVYASMPWKKGVIPVAFDSSISQKYRDQFWQACKVWSDVANVQCRTKYFFESNYVQVTDKTPTGCWTDLGAGLAGGKRVFNFSQGWCWNQPALIHEVGHVLGFMHEHQRPDRDSYIDVIAENAGTMSYAYDKLSLGSSDKSGPYDFLFIMHYWDGSYSINGKPVMVPKPQYAAFAQVMGRSATLSEGDKALVRQVYGNKK